MHNYAFILCLHILKLELPKFIWLTEVIYNLNYAVYNTVDEKGE